jgi:hypothetical protein
MVTASLEPSRIGMMQTSTDFQRHAAGLLERDAGTCWSVIGQSSDMSVVHRLCRMNGCQSARCKTRVAA